MPVTDDKPRGAWPWLWLAWIGMFFAIEGWALANDSGGDTLTENVQYVFGVAGWGWGLAGLLLLATWLTYHFFGPHSRLWKWVEYWKNRKGR